MAFFCSNTRWFFRVDRFTVPIYAQLRFKKTPKRKPRWLPMAPSKIFRIPNHPIVSSEEKELSENLLEEYYRKVESLRKVFKNELKQETINDASTEEKEEISEKELSLLFEENRKENERVKMIREQCLENMFQEKQLELLKLEEDRVKKLAETKLKVEENVRKEIQKYLNYITYEKLEAAIEQAIDNPIDINFAITTDGKVKWEGNPPPEYENEVLQRIAEGQQR